MSYDWAIRQSGYDGKNDRTDSIAFAQRPIKHGKRESIGRGESRPDHSRSIAQLQGVSSMPREKINQIRVFRWALWMLCLTLAGCQTMDKTCPPNVPRELAKVSLPPYVIEPPDILVIDAVRLVPLPPYRISALDSLGIQVTETLPDAPIAGIYTVETDGTVNLGFTYGTVPVLDLTLEEAKKAITQKLKDRLKKAFEVTVVLAETRGMQQIRGQHLVHTDGTVNLGVYGSVNVDNLTVPEAKDVIERHLSQFLLRPEISLDVSGFNSKVYYVITDGGGNGEQVVRLPVTGKTTVLDAVSQVGGLGPISSRFHLWVARPAPEGPCHEQTLAIDWNGIARRGDVTTNYQIFPGDRVYIKADALVTTDTYLARVFAPIERIFNMTLLGNSTVISLRDPPSSSNGSAFFGNGSNTGVLVTPVTR
jgi:polysaccharide export outer membrane protein